MVTPGLEPHQLLVRIDWQTHQMCLCVIYNLLWLFIPKLNVGKLYITYSVVKIQVIWINLYIFVTRFQAKRTPVGIIKERYLILLEICVSVFMLKKGLTLILSFEMIVYHQLHLTSCSENSGVNADDWAAHWSKYLYLCNLLTSIHYSDLIMLVLL